MSCLASWITLKLQRLSRRSITHEATAGKCGKGGSSNELFDGLDLLQDGPSAGAAHDIPSLDAGFEAEDVCHVRIEYRREALQLLQRELGQRNLALLCEADGGARDMMCFTEGRLRIVQVSNSLAKTVFNVRLCGPGTRPNRLQAYRRSERPSSFRGGSIEGMNQSANFTHRADRLYSHGRKHALQDL